MVDLSSTKGGKMTDTKKENPTLNNPLFHAFSVYAPKNQKETEILIKSIDQILKGKFKLEEFLLNRDNVELIKNMLNFYGDKDKFIAAKDRDEKLNEYKTTLQRLQADFENYKKRVEKEKNDFMQFAAANVFSKMLPIVDSFELAMKNKDKKEQFIQGTELIYQQLTSFLEHEGVKKINAANQKFDPFYHEAILQEPSDKDNIVLEELQAGYKYNDRILRYSKVKIGKVIKNE